MRAPGEKDPTAFLVRTIEQVKQCPCARLAACRSIGVVDGRRNALRKCEDSVFRERRALKTARPGPLRPKVRQVRFAATRRREQD
jgi:hypothetical protein